MKKKRVGLVFLGFVLVAISIVLLASSKWVQQFTFAHVLLFSIGTGVAVYGLIPSWWR
ncbi:MAG: hypothetical protein V3S39_04455 [Thermodesulfobacteriota bacterium]